MDQATKALASARAVPSIAAGEPRLLRRISIYRFVTACAVSDFLCLTLAGLLPIALYIHPDEWSAYFTVMAGALLIHLGTTRLSGAYDTAEFQPTRRAMQRALAAAGLTFALLILLFLVSKVTGSFSRVWFVSWAGTSFVLIALQRVIAFTLLESRLAAGACLNRAVLVSTVPEGITADDLAVSTHNRTRAVAQFRFSRLESIADLDALISRYQPDTLILEVPWAEVPSANAWAHRTLGDYALSIYVVPAHLEGEQGLLRLERLGQRVMFQTGEHPISGWDRVLKRAEDIVLASAALFLCAPLLLLVAIAIRIESRGPVFFRQVRGGFNGSRFEVWKFRSMYMEAADAGAARQTSRGDPRVTRVGRFIRRTSIDELPQLFNVLQGTMSLVGPRPHALQTTAEGLALAEAAERYAARHRVKPGITGWAQVNGLRGELDTIQKLRRRVQYDIEYIENWSLATDIKIILMTAVRVFYDPRAY